jgi:hypothetical protein
MRVTGALVVALIAAARATSNEQEPAFVFAATLRPVDALPVDYVVHGENLRATSRPQRWRRLGATTESLATQLATLGAADAKTYVVVGTEAEKRTVETFGARVFAPRRLTVVVINEEAPWPREACRSHFEFIYGLRHFKIAAILQVAQMHLPLVYLDNDALFKGPLAEVAAEFTIMAQRNATLGLSAMPPCLPRADAAAPLAVPHTFCQRNGGVIFMRKGAANIVREWLVLFEVLHSSDGTHARDQFSLRPTLWRHRHELRDLPPRFDCRGKNWPLNGRPCVVEHLRKGDVGPADTPASHRAFGGGVTCVVVGLGLVFWARQWRARYLAGRLAKVRSQNFLPPSPKA